MRTKAIAALSGGVTTARSELAHLTVSGPHYYVEHALAGYLWSAIATAETLLVVLDSSAALGAEPLKRYLHECYLDVLFMVSDPDPDLLAAKSFLSEYAGSRRLVEDYRNVVAAHPEVTLPPLAEGADYFLTPEAEAVDRLDTANAALGGAPDLFARAAQAWKRKKHWHWSDISRSKMVEVLVQRGRLSVQDQLMADSLTKIYNAAAHAAPAWSALPFPSETGSTVPVEPPGAASDRAVTQLAVGADQFLRGVIREVRSYRTATAA